jgi:hypothetical protein
LGAIFLFLSKNFIEIFLCLECISFCAYILIGIERLNKLSATAGLHYLLLSTLPTVLLLFSFFIFYGIFGTFFTSIFEIFFTEKVLNKNFVFSTDFFTIKEAFDISILDHKQDFVNKTGNVVNIIHEACLEMQEELIWPSEPIPFWTKYSWAPKALQLVGYFNIDHFLNDVYYLINS